MSTWNKNWQQAFKKRKLENPEDNHLFACNIFHDDKDVMKYFRKLEKLGATVEIDDLYWESIRVCLSKKIRENILLFILTNDPRPTEVLFNKRTNYLTLDWS